MSRARISLTTDDPALIDGIKEVAKELELTASQYVMDLVAEDIKKRRGYRIVTHYNTGETFEHSDFYTEDDLWESVQAIAQIYNDDLLDIEGRNLMAFEVYEHDKIILKEP